MPADLGNYERSMGLALGRDNNITTGKVYSKVIAKERKGDYLGKTVQVCRCRLLWPVLLTPSVPSLRLTAGSMLYPRLVALPTLRWCLTSPERSSDGSATCPSGWPS